MDRGVHLVMLLLYRLSDIRPWRFGYSAFKADYLKSVLNDESRMNIFRQGQRLSQGYGHRLDARVVEIPWVLSHLPSPAGRLLDSGSSLNHSVVLTSSPLKNWTKTVLTLAPEEFAFWDLGISYVYGDLRDLDFKDNWFDAVVCISTIEHVGMDNSLYGDNRPASDSGNRYAFKTAVQEMRRVLKPGGKLLITFPFGRYEDHGWFQQFDADMADELIKTFNPSQRAEQVFYYHPQGWQNSDRPQAALAEFFDVRTSKYFDPRSTADFPPDFRAGEQAVMCLCLQK